MFKNTLSRFTRAYKGNMELEKKARILSVVDILFFLSVVLTLISQLLTTRDPIYIILMTLCAVSAFISLYALSAGRYQLASNITISLSLLILVFAQLAVDFYSPSFLVRNAMVVYLITGLIGDRRYQEIGVFLSVMTALILLYAFRVIPDNKALDSKLTFDLVVNVIFLIFGFILSYTRFFLTRQSLAYEQKKAAENSERFRRLEALLQNSKKRMEVGEQLLSISDSIRQLVLEFTAFLESIRDGLSGLDHEIRSSQTANTQMVSHSGNVKGTIDQQNRTIHDSSSTIKDIEKGVKEISGVVTSEKEAIEVLSGMSLSLDREMRQALNAIQKVRDSSTVIADTLSVISDIAGRTDMLAMNAAIEAAHAGEYGRGFAIVAAEIRSLSEATGKNSQIIEKKLEENRSDIQSAAEMAEKAGGYFQKFRSEIDHIVETITLVIASMELLESQNQRLMDAVTRLDNSALAVNDSAGSLETLINNNSSSFQEVRNRFEKMDEEVQKRFASIMVQFENLKMESSRLEETGRNNKNDIDALYREIEGLKS